MKYNLSLKHLFIITLYGLVGCGNPTDSEIVVNFYHWRRHWAIDSIEKQYVEKLASQRLYVHFFDVDWHFEKKEATPIAPLYANKQSNDFQLGVKIIPVIFITNRTMEHINSSAIESLAIRIQKQIESIHQKYFYASEIVEIQLDCDWSLGTKEKFFALLKAIKKQNSPKILLSATIRLHQIKYNHLTGVPPIDKGVLMCYNVGKIDGSNTENSILDPQIVSQYIDKLAQYPLPLAIALPIYNWAVVKRRGQVVALLNHLTAKEFETPYYKKIATNEYEVTKSHYLAGEYLYQQDKIRLEIITYPLLENTIDILKRKITTQPLEVIYYHLDSENFKHFSYEDLQTLAHRFH
ncbi:MAG: hypothetical protein EAZ55_02385 [Cytophagales bacterium]|nr:MAG: hypothetical protein EAZ55_02385 [Cytophagales bacterium]